jgi:glycosyltransferase involved in cell wall biosynthesis
MRILIDGQTLATPELGRGIGRVFVELVSALARYDISHEWLITLPPGGTTEVFTPDVLRAVTLIPVTQPQPGGDWQSRTELYRAELAEIVQDHQVDWYWNPNPLMMNVVLPLGLSDVKIALTIHDLIPALLPEIYLNKWNPPEREEYERRLAALTTWPDYLPCVSAGAAAQVQQVCGETRGALDGIPNAIDFKRFWPVAKDLKHHDETGYILAVSGDDPRKGLAQLVEGFCLASQTPALKNLRLVIVCGVAEQTRKTLTSIATKHGVADRLEITGFVSDLTVAQLTRGATAVVFNSLLEGFGLPLLEALAAGVPVAAADIPTSREVCGAFAVYFPANDASAMAEALQQAATARSEGRFDPVAALAHARGFDWLVSASQYSRGFHPRPPSLEASRQRRVALLTPWPPQPSSVANDAYHLSMVLRERCQLTVVHTDDVTEPAPLDGVEIISMSAFLKRRASFDEAIVQIGNNTPFHKAFYKYAIANPSTVIIHDPNIHPFILDAFGRSTKKGERDVYLKALASELPAQEVAAADSNNFIGVDIFASPLNAFLATHSKRVIMHSRTATKALRSKVSNVPVDTYALATRKPAYRSTALDPEIVKLLGDLDGRFVIGAFGHINRLKRLPSVLAALGQIRAMGFDAVLLVVGEVNDEAIDKAAMIDQGLADCVIATGSCSDMTFDACLERCDVVLNLRYPTLGESSGSLHRAFAFGKASLVSAVGQFAEHADDVTWKASVDEHEADELAAMLAYLFKNPNARAQLGRNGKAYADHFCGFELYADRLMAAVAGEQ